MVLRALPEASLINTWLQQVLADPEETSRLTASPPAIPSRQASR